MASSSHSSLLTGSEKRKADVVREHVPRRRSVRKDRLVSLGVLSLLRSPSDAHFVERDTDDQSFVQDCNVFEQALREDRIMKRAGDEPRSHGWG
jgi:hypothetical protein